MREAGVDLKEVAEQLGHSSISVTADVYSHVRAGRACDGRRRCRVGLIYGRTDC